MKKTFALYIAVILTGCAGSRPFYSPKSDIEDAGMSGRVKFTAETYLDNPSGTYNGTLGEFDTYTEIMYNDAGNIVSAQSFRGPDRIKIMREEYRYDASGIRMISSVSYNFKNNSIRKLTYEYDGKGNLIGEREETGGYSMKYMYDRKGYLKTETNSVRGAEGSGKIKYRYDPQGRLVKVRGDMSKEYLYHPDGTVKEIRSGKDMIERFDENGNITEITHRIKMSGDGKKPEIKEATITADYEYDDAGNWIKRTQRYEGNVVGVSLREIVY